MPGTKPKPFVFTLMPFSEDFDDVYHLAIKPACTEAGGYCERVDEQIFVESILDRVYNQITKADLIVADMTNRNPNVFYEVGYAHALGKPAVLLTRNGDDIPFDLKHYPHIIYEGKLTKLKSDLRRKVQVLISSPVSISNNEVDNTIQPVINSGTNAARREKSVRSIVAAEIIAIKEKAERYLRGTSDFNELSASTPMLTSIATEIGFLTPREAIAFRRTVTLDMELRKTGNKPKAELVVKACDGALKILSEEDPWERSFKNDDNNIE